MMFTEQGLKDYWDTRPGLKLEHWKNVATGGRYFLHRDWIFFLAVVIGEAPEDLAVIHIPSGMHLLFRGVLDKIPFDELPMSLVDGRLTEEWLTEQMHGCSQNKRIFEAWQRHVGGRN